MAPIWSLGWNTNFWQLRERFNSAEDPKVVVNTHGLWNRVLPVFIANNYYEYLQISDLLVLETTLLAFNEGPNS